MTPEKRKYHRDYHASRSPAKKAEKLQRQSARRQSLLLAVRFAKAEAGCTDCGEKDPVVLDFDHTDPSTKKDSVAQLVARGASWATLQKEMQKCEVVCANCHRRRTHFRFLLRQEFS